MKKFTQKHVMEHAWKIFKDTNNRYDFAECLVESWKEVKFLNSSIYEYITNVKECGWINTPNGLTVKEGCKLFMTYGNCELVEIRMNQITIRIIDTKKGTDSYKMINRREL